MDERYTIIPYEVNMLFVEGSTQPIYHDGEKYGNELVIVFDGSADFHRDAQVFSIAKGDVFVLRNDYWREITNAKALRICSIFYREQEMLRLSGSYAQLAGYQQLFMRNPFAKAYAQADRLQADGYLLDQLQYFVTLMILEHKLKQEGSEQILNSVLYTIITLLARAKNTQIHHLQISESHFLQTVGYMQECYGQNLSLDELAARAHISKRHFSRLFQESYHCAPLQYLMNLRINRACVLLEETALSITEIASICGFSDANNFATNFKKHKHTTPTSYRKTLLKAIQMSKIQRYSPKSKDS